MTKIFESQKEKKNKKSERKRKLQENFKQFTLYALNSVFQLLFNFSKAVAIDVSC